MSFRFSPYDAIGHVVCGLLILGACEAAHDGTWLIDRGWPPGRISMYLTMAYSIGQFVAVLSCFFLERAFVRTCLRLPDFDCEAAVADQGEVRGRDTSGIRLQSDLWRNLCLGLLIVAAILICGMLWHGARASWGQSDLRKLGYGLLALLGAVGTFDRFVKSARLFDNGHDQRIIAG